MDDVTWAALTLSLTAVCGIYTWFAFRRRGLAAGLKGAGITVLPLAAYLTNTLQMFTRIGDAVVDWAAGLVFSPTVWLGVILAGTGVLLYGAGRVLDRRRRGDREPGRRASEPAGDLPAGRPSRTEPIVDDDDDLADIEAILRKRGIT